MKGKLIFWTYDNKLMIISPCHTDEISLRLISVTNIQVTRIQGQKIGVMNSTFT